MFKINLDIPENLFEELSKSVEFEDIVKGRKGANLVDDRNGLKPELVLIPIVRTTTVYNDTVQRFSSVHYDLIQQIRDKSDLDIDFNNAMIEIYDSSYRKMKYHTDQALDLAPDSYIGIFSCYSDPTKEIRTLKIQNKVTKEHSELILDQNSVVLFSVETNQQHVHKIVLETNKSNPVQDNKWLGITFRLSKTFIQFKNQNQYIIPYFYQSNKILRMANQEERKEFYKHKSRENQTVGYVYPDIDYTINQSDLIQPYF